MQQVNHIDHINIPIHDLLVYIDHISYLIYLMLNFSDNQKEIIFVQGVKKPLRPPLQPKG